MAEKKASPPPPLPAYLGKPKTMCGYHHEDAGIITTNTVWDAYQLREHLVKIKYKIIVSSNDQEIGSITTTSTPSNDETINRQLSEIMAMYAVKRAFFSGADGEQNLFRQETWADRLVDYREKKPSPKHFVVMVRGLQSISLDSVPENDGFRRLNWYGLMLGQPK